MQKFNLKSLRKSAFASMVLTGALALSACAEEAEVVVPEDEIAGVTIENARMVLAAVEGNPAAVYFDFSYDGERSFSLGRVSVEGAENAAMHQYVDYDSGTHMQETTDIPVTQGTKVEFKPGDYHIMAFEVSPDVQPGSSTEVTLTISGGKKHKFDAEVRAAGDER